MIHKTETAAPAVTGSGGKDQGDANPQASYTSKDAQRKRWAVEYAFAQRVGSSPAKFVLAAVAWYANSEGIAWPSIETLAAKVDLSTSMVKRHLTTLKRKGLLVRTMQNGRKVFKLPGFKAWAEAEADKVVSLDRRIYAPQKGASMRQKKAHQCAHNKNEEQIYEQGASKEAPVSQSLESPLSNTRASEGARLDEFGHYIDENGTMYDAEGNWVSDEIPC
jgi:biotin operon repressor